MVSNAFSQVNGFNNTAGAAAINNLSTSGNGIFLNPAVAGSREQIHMDLSYKREWVKFPGAPSTSILNFHAPLANQRLAVGFGLIMDKAGISSMSGLQAAFCLPSSIGRW